jgi:hypothetical protein
MGVVAVPVSDPKADSTVLPTGTTPTTNINSPPTT